MKTPRKLLAAAAAATAVLAVALPPPASLWAHDGEDHGTTVAKSSAAASAPDEVALPKESQFLFKVRTSLATFSAFTTQATLYGTVAPASGGEGRAVAPQTGRLVSLPVQVGQQVRAGQVLAVLDQTLAAPEQIGLATERANAQAELRAAERDYARLKSIEDIAARKDVVNAELRLRQARQNAAILNNQGQQRRVTITSPISGTVDNFSLTVGQQVNQGDELLRVLNPGKLQVQAQVFPQDLGSVTPDAQFRIEGLQGQQGSVPAKVVSFSNVVNPVNQARQLILAVDGASSVLIRPGQAVNVQVISRSRGAKQLTVPTSAVTDLNGKPVVYVHTAPEVFKVRYVQTGTANAQQTTVLAGLSENDRVVTQGTYQLKSIYLNQ